LKLLKQFKDSDFDVKNIQIFHNIADQDIFNIVHTLSHCNIVSVEAGEIVLDSHSPSSSLYIVMKGNLALTSTTNKRQLENSTPQYFMGECVGEISVLDNESHSATIVSMTESELLIIDSLTMWKLIDESNGVAKNLLQLLSFRIRTANAQLRNRQKVGEFYRQLSMVDGLTGLHNRSWLNTQLPSLIENAQATQSELSIIMVDLDHFKKFNDTHGHVLGDDALQTASKVLSAGLRPSDFAARYGGEEMIVILPNTSSESALIVAQRLCQRIASTEVFQNNLQSLPHITASLGLATLKENQDGTAVIAAADAALYRAKMGGRNQVSL
jgi:diguanylate cyclase (GGDEF)-like protein